MVTQIVSDAPRTLARQPLPTRRPRPQPFQIRIVRMFARDAARLIPLMRRDLLIVFRLLGERGRRAHANLTRPRAVRQIDPGDADLVGQISRSMFGQDSLFHTLERPYETAYLRTVSATADTVNLGLGLAVNLPDHVGRRVVAAGGRRLGLVDIHGQARSSLFHALAEGRAQGLTREQLGRHIISRIERGPWSTVQIRAQVIARTETLHAQRISAAEVYRTIPVVTGMLAFDATAGLTDAECTQRDGLVYSFRDADVETGREHVQGTLNWAPHVGNR